MPSLRKEFAFRHGRRDRPAFIIAVCVGFLYCDILPKFSSALAHCGKPRKRSSIANWVNGRLVKKKETFFFPPPSYKADRFYPDEGQTVIGLKRGLGSVWLVGGKEMHPLPL